MMISVDHIHIHSCPVRFLNRAAMIAPGETETDHKPYMAAVHGAGVGGPQVAPPRAAALVVRRASW